jgi:glutamine amidotransferase PdxT
MSNEDASQLEGRLDARSDITSRLFQGNVLVATFHPELSGDPTVHRYFLDMVKR